MQNVVHFLRDAKRGRFSYSLLGLNVFNRFFFGLLDWALQVVAKNGKFRITNSVSMIVPLEYAVPYLFPFPHKFFRFRFCFAKFRFRFHISLPFPFFRGKVGKIPLRFHPYFE